MIRETPDIDPEDNPDKHQPIPGHPAPTPAETTIVETAESLRGLGLLEKRSLRTSAREPC